MALAAFFPLQQPPSLMICLESAVMCAENGSLGSYKVTASGVELSNIFPVPAHLPTYASSRSMSDELAKLVETLNFRR
jgi:hypothetical protein